MINWSKSCETIKSPTRFCLWSLSIRNLVVVRVWRSVTCITQPRDLEKWIWVLLPLFICVTDSFSFWRKQFKSRERDMADSSFFACHYYFRLASIHSLILSLILSFIHSWFIHSLLVRLIYRLIHWLIDWLIHWFVHSFIHSFID